MGQRTTILPLKKKSNDNFISGVYGSPVARQWIKDAYNGVDSLDIITIGDSNAMSPSNYGWTMGIFQALVNLGVPQYATPLVFTASDTMNAAYPHSNTRSGGEFTPFIRGDWAGRSNGTITAYTLSQQIQSGSAAAAEVNTSLLSGFYKHEGVATASSSTSLTLASTASSTNSIYVGCWINILLSSGMQEAKITAYNGTTKVATVASWPSGTPSSTATYTITAGMAKPIGFYYAPHFVAKDTTYTSPANGSSIDIPGNHPLIANNGQAGASCQYRLVYGKFSNDAGVGASTGKFRLRVMKGVATAIASDSADRLVTGGPSFDTAILPFTSTATSGVVDTLQCAYDGYNQGATWQIAGPFVSFWHSVVNLRKGFSVTNLTYSGGKSSTDISDIAATNPNYIIQAIYELYKRQVAAGGSGRILIWWNSGINGPDSSASYTAALDNFISSLTALINLDAPSGFSIASNLALMACPTHPTVTGDPGDSGWGAVRASIISGARTWLNSATTMNPTVIDLEKFYTGTELKSRFLYQYPISSNQYQAHLQGPPTLTTASGSVTWGDTTFNTFFPSSAMANNGYLAYTTRLFNSFIR